MTFVFLICFSCTLKNTSYETGLILRFALNNCQKLALGISRSSSSTREDASGGRCFLSISVPSLIQDCQEHFKVRHRSCIAACRLQGASDVSSSVFVLCQESKALLFSSVFFSSFRSVCVRPVYWPNYCLTF